MERVAWDRTRLGMVWEDRREQERKGEQNRAEAKERKKESTASRRGE